MKKKRRGLEAEKYIGKAPISMSSAALAPVDPAPGPASEPSRHTNLADESADPSITNPRQQPSPNIVPEP
jgi:hypothetical protein